VKPLNYDEHRLLQCSYDFKMTFVLCKNLYKQSAIIHTKIQFEKLL